jgi:hypothetical protein
MVEDLDGRLGEAQRAMAGQRIAAMALLPGRTECWRRFQQDLSEHADDVNAAFRRADVRAQRWLLVSSPRADVAVWVLDAPAIEPVFALLAAGESVLMRWLRRQWLVMFGLDLSQARHIPRVDEAGIVAHGSPTSSS